MTINLIPPKFKKEKERQKVISLVFSSVILISSMVLILSAIIYIANYFTEKNIDLVSKQIEAEDSKLQQFSGLLKKINSANAKLQKIDLINSDRVLWNNVIGELANDTPQKLKIKSLSLDKETQKITLAGVAETRRDIAQFKEKLEESNFFKSVTFYSSAYNTGENSYSFNLTAEMEKTK